MPAPFLARLRPWLPLLVILILTAGVYQQTRTFGFINEWDDNLYVLENRHVLRGLSWEGVVWAFTSTVQACNWHPLTWISLQADVTWFGRNPGAMHGVAALLHLINTALVYLFFQRATWRHGVAAVVAALFALHPLHVESVAWISERKDLLSALFWFLTMLLYLEYARRGGVGRYLLTLGSFALGLLAKPMLVTLPFVLLLLDYWPLNRLPLSWGVLARRVWEKAPFFLLAAGSAAMTLYVQNHCGAVIEVDSLPIALRIENSVVAYALYLERMVWPEGLAFFYPHPQRHQGLLTLLSVCFLGSVTALAVQQHARRPWFPVGWLFYLGTLVPVIGLVQVGSQGWAERYTYIPLTGIFLILAMAVVERPWWRPGHTARPWVLGAGGVVLALLVWRSYVEVGYWKDRETLYRRALAVTERNYLAHAQYASHLEDENRLEEALHHARMTLKYNPDSAPSHITLGNVYRKRRELVKAREHYARAAELDTRSRTPHYNMGILLFESHRPVEAEWHFRRAMERVPDDPETVDNLGAALFAQGRVEEALPYFLEAARLDAYAFNAHYNTARALDYLNRGGEALPYYARAVFLDPSQDRAHFYYGQALAQVGRTQEAAEQFQATLALSPNHHQARALLEKLNR